MSCLGERLTALVDGELDHEERERALAHLAACRQCREEADTLRRLKSRLRALASPPPEVAAPDVPSVDFLTKLYAMGEQPGRPGSAARTRPGPPRTPRGLPRSVGSRPRDNRPAARAGKAAATARRAPRRRYLAVGAAAAAVVFGLGTASYAMGGESDQPPPVMPAFDQLEAEHALTNGVVPLSDVSPRP